jgi:hypothetical protein
LVAGSLVLVGRRELGGGLLCQNRQDIADKEGETHSDLVLCPGFWLEALNGGRFPRGAWLAVDI